MIIVRNNNSNYDTMLIESVDIDDLEISLRSQLEEQLSDLAFLEKEKENSQLYIKKRLNLQSNL